MKTLKKTCFVLLMIQFLMLSCSDKKEYLYVGTYAQRGSEGIYVYEFDRNTRVFTLLQTLPEVSGPNFLAIHPSGNFLFSVNTAKDQEGINQNVISSFAVNKSNGNLTFINQMPVYGVGACHISLDREGKRAFVSHYRSGSLAVFPVNSGGVIGDSIQTIAFEGSSVTSRQDRSHVHSILVSPDNRFVYVADLGTDKIMIYALDNNTGRLLPATQPWLAVNPGAGPRHFTFHPVKPYIYLADELSSTVSVLRRNRSDGSLELIQNLSTLPDDFNGSNTVADIHTDPEGRFLYISNRGHNSLAIFSIDENGGLGFIAHESVRGDHPRNFMMDNDGEFIMVANQFTDNIVLFNLDENTGLIEYTGVSIGVPAPACLKWLR